METILPFIYLSILLLFLSSIAFFLIQEIQKKRNAENKLYELQKKVRENNSTCEDHYILGTLYLSKKLFDQAIIQFRCSISLWDSNDYFGLANLYNTIGYTYFESGQYELAIYYYKESIKNVSDYSTAWNNLGYAYERRKMTSEAMLAYLNVLKYDKNNIIANGRIESLKRKLKIRDDRI